MGIEEPERGIWRKEGGSISCSPLNPESRIPNPDQHFLDHAVRLAATGLGRTWPNPSVGCVLVRDGHILATARSADGGRPHAETQALAAAGNAARGATAYVSLEPCAHHGKTPPCAEALIKAGVARIIIAATDPDPRVSGKGIALLKQAGIAVELAHHAAAARDLRGFFSRVDHGIPYVAAKVASSLDGQIADTHGESQWITGGAARTHVHKLRSQFDAILTGIGTVLADDPQLTVRLPGIDCRHQPRIIADRRLRLPLNSNLVATAETQPVWLITGAEAVEQAASHATELREHGVVLHIMEDATLAPDAILRTLGAAGISRLLVEAGPHLTTAFLGAGAVDTLHWYRAPMLLGNAGMNAIRELDTSLGTAARFSLAESRTLAADRYDRYELKPCSQA